jgi:hypothetical protein
MSFLSLDQVSFDTSDVLGPEVREAINNTSEIALIKAQQETILQLFSKRSSVTPAR